jgi:hypothetical protein
LRLRGAGELRRFWSDEAFGFSVSVIHIVSCFLLHFEDTSKSVIKK